MKPTWDSLNEKAVQIVDTWPVRNRVGWEDIQRAKPGSRTHASGYAPIPGGHGPTCRSRRSRPRVLPDDQAGVTGSRRLSRVSPYQASKRSPLQPRSMTRRRYVSGLPMA
jgi:hypothetical protein